MKTQEITQAMVQQLQAGTLDESSKGVLLRTLQISMSSSIINNLKVLDESVTGLRAFGDKIMQKLLEKIEVAMETADLEELIKYTDFIINKQMQILDLQRKIHQGKELFPIDTFSEDEKQILKLLNSFSSAEEKKKFLEVVKKTLSDKDVPGEFEDN